MLTIQQAGDLLALHPETVRRLIKSGKLRAVKVAGQWRIHSEDLAEYTGRDLTADISDQESVGLAIKELQGKTIELDSRLIRVERQLAAVIAQGAKP